MTIRITAEAINYIEEGARKHIEALGEGLVPVIIWVTDDTDPQRRVPRLGVGLIEKEKGVGRSFECETPGLSIAQLLPDEIIQRYRVSRINLVGDELVFEDVK
jgi:hypothetical protein